MHRVLPSGQLAACVVVLVGALSVTPVASAADVDRARIVGLADKVSQAWVGRIASTGEVKPPTPGLLRSNVEGEGHRIGLGYSLLKMASRLPRGSRRTRVLVKAFALIDRACSKDQGKPFSLLFMPLAYRVVRDSFPGYEGARRHLARWGQWINSRDPGSVVAGHQCYADRDCYDNWKLFRAVAGLETVDTDPIGNADPRSFIANREQTVLAAREVLNASLPANQGPLVSASWQVGDAASLSDPPLYPPAYHLLALALVDWVGVRHPGSISLPGLDALSKAEAYSLLAMAPDGDVAVSGRSQLQSWTLAATVVSAAARLARGDSGAWAALADRALGRLASADYTDRTGVLAITPSAKSGSLRGLDGYADSIGYNGLTLAFLNMAADLLPAGEFVPGSIPADSDGSWVDPNGSGLATVRVGDLWWQWRTAQGGTGTSTSGTAQDFRGDTGLVQAKALIAGRWSNLLAARPIGFHAAESGPAMVAADGEAMPFLPDLVRQLPDGLEMRGRFRSTARSSDEVSMVVRQVNGKLEVSWPVRSAETFVGNLPLVDGRVRGSRVDAAPVGISLTPTATIRRSTAVAPGATSVFARLFEWRMRSASDGLAKLVITPRP